MRGTFAALALVGALASSVAVAAPTQVKTMRLTAEVEIISPLEVVWKSLVSGESLVAWCPAWKAEANRDVKITKVGDVLDFTDEWGNGGRSVVTYFEPGKELRVANEPNDGSYLCQSKLTLMESGHGTRVVYVEQYTDEQDAKTAAATAAKTEASMKATLSALQALVQGPE